MRARWLLSVWVAIVVVAALTAVAVESLDTAGGGDQTVEAPGTTGPEPDARGGSAPPPPENGATVTGTIDDLHVEGAVVEPRELAVPLTVVADRGFGNGATITGATVSGQAASIEWDAGRPLVFTAGAAMIPDPMTVGLSPNGFVLALGGTACGFEPGRYTLATPVAVGTSGVAQPRDSVTFDATADTQIAFRGTAAVIHSGTTTLRLRGPGRVILGGDLEVARTTGRHRARRVELGSGAYELRLTRVEGRASVVATLQGNVVAR